MCWTTSPPFFRGRLMYFFQASQKAIYGHSPPPWWLTGISRSVAGIREGAGLTRCLERTLVIQNPATFRVIPRRMISSAVRQRREPEKASTRWRSNAAVELNRSPHARQRQRLPVSFGDLMGLKALYGFFGLRPDAPAKRQLLLKPIPQSDRRGLEVAGTSDQH